MAAADMMAAIALDADDTDRKNYKLMWERCRSSIEQGKTMFFLPMNMANTVGNATVEDMARRFG
jgi:hypothetical protein